MTVDRAGRASRATITTVARHVGVSVATVSRVMNGHPTVAPELIERVRAAAAELGYTASPTARSLVLGRTHTVAVVVPDLGNPFFQGILRGVARAADVEGYHVLVADTAEDVAAEPDKALRARGRCDAVVLVSPRLADDRLRDLLPDLGPAVVVNRRAPDGIVPSLHPDYRAGMAVLADHLADLGHRRLLYLAGPAGTFSDRERRAGLADVARARGLDLTVLPGGVTQDDGARAAAAVLATDATAVLAFNDLVAMGLLARLREHGVVVPREVSVVGFDGIDLGAAAAPPLTTVRVPAEEIGAAAWRRLARLIDGNDAGDDADAPAAAQSFRPELVVRSSSAPPPTSPTDKEAS
ncbi:MAG: hypothetical protein BGO96_07485 [Micrococcales bacterium 73-15]|uniref:LacI family DNA-binding transcriptional regulator n=1 Tax=Salana multivorans TaxID=120377 RepID=UPI000962CBAF|nr:LacI family DNA-binding transcriptional regulator [Salana multivorans]OJX96114.1 MAG: hypothetical protein BGO96_07485 [Micrococcales bacterium 73-15]